MSLSKSIVDQAIPVKTLIGELSSLDRIEVAVLLEGLSAGRKCEAYLELSRTFVSKDFARALESAGLAVAIDSEFSLKRRAITHYSRLLAYNKEFLQASQNYKAYPIDENELSEILEKRFQIWQWEKQADEDLALKEMWQSIVTGDLKVPVKDLKVLAEHIRKLYGREGVDRLQDDLRKFADQMFMHQHLGDYAMLINYLSDLSSLI